MRETLFKPLVESLQKDPGQEPNCIRRTKIEWALADSVNCFFQELAHFRDVFQRSLGEIKFVLLPAAILLSSLPTQLRQSLGVSVAETQASFQGGRLAGTTSLRLSLAVLSTPVFRAFISLKPDGGTLRRPGDRRSLGLVMILLEEPAVLGCAGDAGFAGLCRNLPTHLVEIL